MALYEYKCKSCGERFSSSEYGLERLPHLCNGRNTLVRGEVARVYSFAFHRPMQEHFNVGVGKPISNKRQLDDHLRRKSEADMERTGIPCDYQQADLRDRDIFPVTEDGLKETYDRRPSDHPIRKAIEQVI